MRRSLVTFNIVFPLILSFFLLVYSGRLFAQETSAEDSSAKLFVQKCSMCHTIGGGELTGPDLSTAAKWNAPDLLTAIKRMESKVGPLTPEEISGLADFIKQKDSPERIKAEEARQATQVTGPIEIPSAKTGEELFLGKKPLLRGGVACFACHAVDGAGGNLGPDLTSVFEKMGSVPLISASEKANFNVMRAAYRDHLPTHQEAVHLAAYFEKLSQDKKTAKIGWKDSMVPVLGAIGAVSFLVLMLFFYRKRNTGVRSRLVRENMRR